MNRFYPLLALILIIGTVKAQTGKVNGVIKTADNQPAAYVNVVLKEINKGTISGEDGTFQLKNIKAGSYTIVTSFIGLQPQEQSVNIKEGETTDVNFTLSESAQQLSEVVITDSRTLNERTSSIGKSTIKPMDLPQSVVVLDRVVLERQQSLRLSDVLMNANGVYVMGTTGGTQEEIAGRGFSYGSNNTFKNGSRFNNAIMPEVSSLERVEVLKGSNAILFGNVAAGGVLNLITKKPKFEKGGEFSFRTGSYDFYKPSLDIYGAIDNSEKVAFRINTSYENAGSFRDNVHGERIYFNPSLLVRAGKNTEVLIEGDYLKDDRTLDYGIGAVDYQIIDLPRDRFIGASWSYAKAEQKSTSLTVTHQLNTNWQIRALASYQGFNNDIFGTTRPNASSLMVGADGKWKRGLQRSGTDQKYYLAQVDLNGTFKTGTIEHNVLFGADADQYKTEALAYQYKNPLLGNKNVYDSINVFDLNLYTQRQDIPLIDKTGLTESPIDRLGIYIQDHVTLTEKLKLLAGLRYSSMKSESTPYTYASNDAVATKGKTTSFSDDAFSPRFGIVYQPFKSTSMFASYANSFTLNTTRDTTDTPLPPSIIDQFEIGVKNDLLKGLLSLNVTAYQIVNDNLAQSYVPANPKFPNAQQLAGEVTSKGVEVDFMTKSINGLSFIAGYSYNDTRYTKSSQFIEGSKLRYNPSHTANASVYYAFDNAALKGLNLGLIGFYMGDRVAGRSTQINVPNDTRKLIPVSSFFQFDATAGYSFRDISVRVKVSNLLNELSYHVHDDNSVNPIAPRMFSTTIAYKL
jgi:iron complex outermembrane receptor protein